MTYAAIDAKAAVILRGRASVFGPASPLAG